MLVVEPRHEPKVRQGVTTEVVGFDGNPHVPFRSGDDLRNGELVVADGVHIAALPGRALRRGRTD